MEKDGENGGGHERGSKRLHFFFVQGRILPPPWVAGEELDGLAASRLGPIKNLREPSCNGDMKPKSHEHPLKKDELEVTINYVNRVGVVNKKN